MTESDIYQLVGKAYCDGISQGMEKSASGVISAMSKALRSVVNKKGIFAPNLKGGFTKQLPFNSNGIPIGAEGVLKTRPANGTVVNRAGIMNSSL